MKPRQFSERIGNIHDELIEQARSAPNYERRRNRRKLRGFVAAAAAIALMATSFAVGALAFQLEPEPVREPETIVIGDSGITLILPDEWAGKYGAETSADGGTITVYHLGTREDADSAYKGAGVLFRIVRGDELLPIDYVYPVPGYTIASTADTTYSLLMASDVQYDQFNPVTSKEYLELSNSVGKIQILLTDWLTKNSTNVSNWVSGTVYVYFLDGSYGAPERTVVCDGTQSKRIGELIGAQDYRFEGKSFPADIWITMNGEEYYLNSQTGEILNAAGYPYSAVMPAEDLSEFLEILG
jgi:hypothetical protein